VRSSLFSRFFSLSLFSCFSPGSAGGDRMLGWRWSGSTRLLRQSTVAASSSPPHRRVSLSPTRQGSRRTLTDSPAPSTQRHSTQRPSTRRRCDLHPAALHSTRRCGAPPRWTSTRHGAPPQWRGAPPQRRGAPPGSMLHLCGDGDGSKARGRA
jgi:hypothetical protein